MLSHRAPWLRCQTQPAPRARQCHGRPATVILVLSPDQETAVELLIAQATADVGTTSTGPVVRTLRRFVTRLRSRRDRTAMGRAEVGTRWQDMASYERPGWHARGAYVTGSHEPVFEIDYEV